MAHTSYPVAPTASLPPLARLQACSTDQIEQAILNLHAIYRSDTLASRPVPTHRIHDLSAPDSGYASAEEEDDDECGDSDWEDADLRDADEVDILRSDAFERACAVRWLTAFVARSEAWTYHPALPDEEADARAQLVDAAAALLAFFAGDEDAEDIDITRKFSFVVAHGEVQVELNDAPLLADDHTSVGLQSWGSAIVLAEDMCKDPDMFGLTAPGCNKMPRVLELGAGTGLLSIVARKLLPQNAEIVATDYHPNVLQNLRQNVASNFPFPLASCPTPITVACLDWQYPLLEAPLDARFDVILAADVIYLPEHARWIKQCVEQLLVQPGGARGGVFWLIVPTRATGRHAGMRSTVNAVFPSVQDLARPACPSAADSGADMVLAILSARQMGKHAGIGRADESGYTLFEIGWVPSPSVFPL